ncbi:MULTISPECIES: GIN domain-containing protein [unclassified Myxococcus]|uniref:GIN domain-containing protein n=1 Tax=unclassified Myxococcus TaxID=2648731 RepID=UPI00157B9994|nr:MULTISPECIES: DUF2807 domain-containing protein [unclassified Myxococcus]NTX07804.1 DUF2807 domain-containing protein [Myxococcus sp. CA040A]NTX40973.1 DUF2807 domain-containing protein [Myxococcus sp. CA033]
MWKRVAAGVLTAWWLAGCSDFDVHGNGDTVTEERQVEAFQSVTHEGNLDVVVREGETATLTVTLDSNLQDNVRTFKGPDASLFIVTDGNLHPKGTARVEITVPRLVGATLEGSGSMTVEGFIGQTEEHVRLESTGSGGLRYCGGARTVEAKVEGSGRVVMCMPDSVLVERADFSLSGSGELSWTGAASDVHVASEGSGRVKLKGTSSRLSVRMEGSGDLEARELRAVDLDLVSEGSGDASATVEGGTVNVSLDASGDVDLWGDASVRSIRVNGSGRVNWH